MSRNIIILIIIITLTSIAKGDEVPVIDVFILAGQSNACGKASSGELSTILDSVGVPYQDYAANDASILYSHREINYHDGTTVRYDQSLGELRIKPDIFFGPEMSIARDISIQTDNQTAFLKFVSGGSSVQSWIPNGLLHIPFLTFLSEQRSELESLGYSVRWKGLFWAQGESDGTASGSPPYVDRFNTLTEALRIDLNEPELPVVMAQIKSNLVDMPWFEYSKLNQYTASINEQMVIVASEEPTIAITISNNDLTLRPGDGIHYSADSYIELGHRLADAYENQITPKVGDVNRDGVIDITDLSLLAGNWQMDEMSWGDGDFNGDSIVNVTDLGLMSTNWDGDVSTFTLIPEPTTILLLVSGVLMLLRKNSRIS